jgi:hypothetical protein
MTKLPSTVSTNTELLSLLSLGLLDTQMGHWHAMMGTPCEVPVPKKVIFTV